MVKTKNNERCGIFTADYYYLYTKNAEGDIKLHAQIPIESNYVLIDNLLKERNSRETSTIIKDTESISAIIDQIRSSSDRYGGTYAGDEG